MLILTRKYELLEINNTKAGIVIVGLGGLSYLICNYITSIPDSINLLISVPLSFLSTFLWEYFINKKNRIFDEDGLKQFLYAIDSNRKPFVERFILKFIKVHGSHKTFLKLNQSNTIEEIYLLCLLIEPSFLDLRNHLNSSLKVQDLFNKLNEREFELTKDYGINFQNLAFFYEMNTKYFFHYYGIGNDVKLNYTLTNPDLIIQKSFIDTPVIIDFGTNLNKKFGDDPYKKEYLGLLKILIEQFIKDPAERSNTYLADFFKSLYLLYSKIRNQENYITLEIFLAYDMIVLASIVDEKYFNIDDILRVENVSKIKELTEYLKNKSLAKNAVFLYSYASMIDIKSYLDNPDNFSLQDDYDIKVHVYINQMNYYLNKKDYYSLGEIIKDLETYTIRTPYTKIIIESHKWLLDYFTLNKTHPMSELELPNKTHQFYNEGEENSIKRLLSNISKIPFAGTDEIDYIILNNFFVVMPIGLLKNSPLYFRQPFEKISRYLK